MSWGGMPNWVSLWLLVLLTIGTLTVCAWVSAWTVKLAKEWGVDKVIREHLPWAYRGRAS